LLSASSSAAICLALGLFLAACAQDEGAKQTVAQAGSATRKTSPFVDSLAIHSVMVDGNPMKNVAEGLGLILEKKGFRKISIAGAPFEAGEEGSKESSFEARARAFAAFAAKEKPASDFSLYAEFVGSPGKVEAVRGVLADGKGNVVWKDEQVPGDPDFDRVNPKELMTCCLLLAERLDPLLVKSPKAETEEEGPMERLWAAKSGLPDAGERKAMEARCAAMKKKAGEFRIVVFPVRLIKGVDRAAAEGLCSLLEKEKLCSGAAVAAASPRFEVKPSSNEMKMLWDLARTFRKYVGEKAPDADYVLCADYMMSPRDGRVMAVHFVICDHGGEWVVVDMSNEHHDDFQAISPKTAADCNRLVIRRLKGYLD